MNNLTKYLPSLLLFGLLVCVLLLVNMNSNLDRAVERLEAAEQKIDSSLTSLRAANQEIDSVRNNLIAFSAYVRDIRGRVEILDLNDRIGNDRFRSQSEKLRVRLRQLYKDLDATGKELPEVPVAKTDKARIN